MQKTVFGSLESSLEDVSYYNTLISHTEINSVSLRPLMDGRVFELVLHNRTYLQTY